jgi:hypothetical protein
MTPGGPVVVASYPARHHADAVAEELRGYKIGAAVVPSADRAGSWDVMVNASDAERASAAVKGLQDR